MIAKLSGSLSTIDTIITSIIIMNHHRQDHNDGRRWIHHHPRLRPHRTTMPYHLRCNISHDVFLRGLMLYN